MQKISFLFLIKFFAAVLGDLTNSPSEQIVTEIGQSRSDSNEVQRNKETIEIRSSVVNNRALLDEVYVLNTSRKERISTGTIRRIILQSPEGVAFVNAYEIGDVNNTLRSNLAEALISYEITQHVDL